MAALIGRHQKDGINCKIFAFDKNPQRALLLKQRMSAAGAQEIVQVSNEDFLSVDIMSSKFKDVTCVLLDPSCSGSGVARVLERVIERQGGTDASKLDDERLEKLRVFQIAALRKAMTFPAVKYVVYSTCSIHVEENESVIAEVLSSSSKQDKAMDQREQIATEGSAAEVLWSVAEPQRLIKWERRGQPYPGLPCELQQRLIRCHPSDGLNGFFVAVLEKQNTPTQNDARPRGENQDIGKITSIMETDFIVDSSGNLKRKAHQISCDSVGNPTFVKKRSMPTTTLRPIDNCAANLRDRFYCTFWRPYSIYQQH